MALIKGDASRGTYGIHRQPEDINEQVFQRAIAITTITATAATAQSELNEQKMQRKKQTICFCFSRFECV